MHLRSAGLQGEVKGTLGLLQAQLFPTRLPLQPQTLQRPGAGACTPRVAMWGRGL